MISLICDLSIFQALSWKNIKRFSCVKLVPLGVKNDFEPDPQRGINISFSMPFRDFFQISNYDYGQFNMWVFPFWGWAKELLSKSWICEEKSESKNIVSFHEQFIIFKQ